MRRRSASVIKVGVHAGNEAFKRRLAYSVTVRVLAYCLSQKHLGMYKASLNRRIKFVRMCCYVFLSDESLLT